MFSYHKTILNFLDGQPNFTIGEGRELSTPARNKDPPAIETVPMDAHLQGGGNARTTTLYKE